MKCDPSNIPARVSSDKAASDVLAAPAADLFATPGWEQDG